MGNKYSNKFVRQKNNSSDVLNKIAAGDLESAISEAMKQIPNITSKDKLASLYSISFEYHKLKNQTCQGIIPKETEYLMENKIANRLIQTML